MPPTTDQLIDNQAEMYALVFAALDALTALLNNTRYRLSSPLPRVDRLNHVRADLELLAGNYPRPDR